MSSTLLERLKRRAILEGSMDKRMDPRFKSLGFIPFAFHLLPAEGLARIAAVMRGGEMKGREGWEEVPVEEHLNHALAHIYAYLAGLHSDHHLANAGCRILMALALDSWEDIPTVKISDPTPKADPTPETIPSP